MFSLTNKRIIYYLLPAISGILSGIVQLFLIHFLAWIMLIPLFYSILKEQRYSFLKGFICGTFQGAIVSSWMFLSIGKYSGTDSDIGLPLWLITSAYFGLILGIQAFIFKFFQHKLPAKINTWYFNAILAGCCWISIDWIHAKLTPGIPWVHYQYYVSQIKWEVPIQITAYTGIAGLSFLIVLINFLLTESIIAKRLKRVLFPLAIYFILIIIGYFRYNSLSPKQNTLKVALICDNIEATARWDANNGDSLASQFFKLNYLAEKTKPQLIVWSESSIPWNLAMDDDFITKCLQITWPSQAGHIIGIFSPSDDTSKRYNSAYYIRPDGAITGRYDKMQLLSFLEQPIKNNKLPFFDQHARTDIQPGKRRSLIQTNVGNAGILICNEILISRSIKETIGLGADFLVVLANDAWFEGSKIANHHFYINRLRAVESGIGIIVNSNRGKSALIDYKGRILIQDNGKVPNAVSADLPIYNYHSVYALLGDWLNVLSFVYLIIILVTIITTKSKRL